MRGGGRRSPLVFAYDKPGLTQYMFRFQNLSIRTKLVSIILLGMASAMTVALANFIFFELYSAKRNLTDELTVLSRITAARSGAALTFGDIKKAQENLSQLGILDSVQAACIYDADDNLFAAYTRHKPSNFLCTSTPAYIETAQFDDRIVAVADITHRNVSLGKIIVLSDLSRIERKAKNWVKLAGLMFLIATIVVVVMAMRMQSAVVSPLKHLMEVMARVRDENDLGIRAVPAGNDELGKLVDSFNDMLAMVESSRMDLEIVYNELVFRSTKAETTAVELEARNEQIKELLSGAAHDLRQPLQAMAIFVDMLQFQLEDEKYLNLTEKLKAAMHNLQAMFTDILDFSRLDHKAGTAELQDIHLEKLFGKLQLEFEVLTLRKGIQFRTHVNAISVRGISGVIERIVRNLVSNAVNYTDTGGVLLAARKKRDCVVIEVWDTGIGIPENRIDSVFKKFEQVDNKGVSSHKGYGLGLAIVKQFADMMGYKLEVVSREGKGSCFRMVIPNVAKENAQSRSTVAFSSDEIFADNYRQTVLYDSDQLANTMLKTHVILVDDEPAIRSILALLLKSWDMEVTEFAGMQGVEDYFGSSDFLDPDIIISDYQLGPNLTGDAVIEEIRMAVGIDVPALIVTGNASPAIHEEIRAKGFDLLLKPVGAAQLRTVLHRMLE
ncbi:ATP-binding region, ATPase-like protein [Saccharophagus degradans 2-40]|uniref:histidine kinase n=2 Tax=Saccharophagus degradans TaxID=86304 RepID=Q21KE7_SACD2|nr:ATP-binding region, ATPase-like protein [Saccharophagus degradans 2-40]